MAKDVIISTGSLNSYGSRVLTEGIDLKQYRQNPVLLWMHRRAFEGGSMPIGRMENLRVDGDRLIGTPVFDEADEFARKIAAKWEAGFLRAASAGLEVLETSQDPALLLPGQTRSTITRCRLEEVSIVDIGANADALQLRAAGRPLILAAGEANDTVPLLEPEQEKNAPEEANQETITQNNKKAMNEELLQLLGLPAEAAEQEVAEAVRLMKRKADEAETLQLAGITALVDAAIAEKRISAEKKEHFVNLGRAAGADMLRETLELMQPQRKPTDLIRPQAEPAPEEPNTFAKLSDATDSQIKTLKEQNPEEYARLYKAEYGVEL